MQTSTTAVVKRPDNGDLTLQAEFTAVRDIAPPTPMVWKKLLMKLVTPRQCQQALSTCND